MSPEIQLVLIGGLIAIASSLTTALLTNLLAYRLDKRREKGKLRVELSKTFGQVAKQKGNVPEEWQIVHKAYADFLGRPMKAEDLSFLLGLLGRNENPKQ